MRFAIVDATNSIVINICEWDGGEWLPPIGTYIVQSDSANVGWIYDPILDTFSNPFLASPDFIEEIVDDANNLLEGSN